MRLSDIPKGTRAIKRVPLPLVNVPSVYTAETPELLEQVAHDKADAEAKGEPAIPEEVLVGIRVLTLDELTTVYEKAGEFARKKGVTEPNDSDPVYNLGLSIYTAAMACVDIESDPANPVPFFGKRGDVESAALELLSSPHIGRDGIAYLAEQQELWQDLSNPRANRVPPALFYKAIQDLADDNANRALKGFLALRPGMQFHLMRSMAVQLLSSYSVNSSSGVTSPEMTPNG